MKFVLILSIAMVLMVHPARANDHNLVWGMGVLKDVSGMIGAAMACNNQSIHDDAATVYRSAFKAMIKNGVIQERDAQHVFDLNSETAAKVEKDFKVDGPFPCSDLPDVWESMKEELGI